MVGPKVKREVVEFLTREKKLKPHRACQLVGLESSTYYYKSYSSREDKALRENLVKHSRERIRWGFPRMLVLVRRDGFKDNHKRVKRIYQEANLQLTKRPKKKMRNHLRLTLPQAERPNHIWSMDFVSEELFDLKRFRCFTLVDDFTHESLCIEADRNLPSEKIVGFLNLLKTTRGLPEIITCDNGPEFISQNIDVWAYQNKVQIKFIQPGKPTQNAFIESFNGKFRDECLNQHWFLNLADARKEIEIWRNDYNENRPHRSLNMKTPNEFAKEYKIRQMS